MLFSSSYPQKGGLRVEVQRTLDRATSLAVQVQHRQGFWESIPDPRILENALVVCALSHGPKEPRSAEAIARARHWLQSATPQRHHRLVEVLDGWLKRLALGQAAPLPLELGNVFSDPVFAVRGRLMRALALVERVPTDLDAAALRKEIAAAYATAGDDALKQWSLVELLAVRVMVESSVGDVLLADEACSALAALQSPDGSFMANPVSSAMACLALNLRAPHAEATERARNYFSRTQADNGTWHFCTADVWDTTLTMRAFSNQARFDDLTRDSAVQFSIESQNSDGGWPFRRGVESDTDTTSSALLALRRAPGSEANVAAALAHLQRNQEASGVWRTWLFKKDPPTEDAVAHIVAALELYRDCHDIDTGSARAWLCSKYDGGWTPRWYPGLPYALHEIGAALGRTHPLVERGASLLAETQNADGGFGPYLGSQSQASATGLAMAALIPTRRATDTRVVRAARFLAESQNLDGSWSGLPEMYGPRPFASHYQNHTQAFAAFGLSALARHLRTSDVSYRDPQPMVGRFEPERASARP